MQPMGVHMYINYRLYNKLLFLLLVVAVGSCPVQAAASYGWKMAVLKLHDGLVESLRFNRTLHLADGDQFQVMIIPEQPLVINVLYEDTNGLVQVLYQNNVAANQLVVLPANDHTFRVSPPSGKEKIHVVVSAKPLANLERKLTLLPNNSAAVLDELIRMKTAIIALGEDPEKGIPIAGVYRTLNSGGIRPLGLGMYDYRKFDATSFQGSDTYVKTIRFDH
ncbi:hypothetical protein TI04_09220 [Achromatium sp. WMS2]|nr:hypothetical protein TI04_09220 [Achromatium sp. WMS2]